MKKLPLSSITLMLLSVSVLLFYIGCSSVESGESVSQSAPMDTTQENPGIIVYYKYGQEIWKCNYDGSNHTRINIVLPKYTFLSPPKILLSPDSKKIFFCVGEEGYEDWWVSSVNIDGTGFTKITKIGWKDGFDLKQPDSIVSNN